MEGICEFCGHETTLETTGGYCGGEYVTDSWEECTNARCKGENEPQCFICDVRQWEYGTKLLYCGGEFYCAACLAEEQEAA